VLARVLGSRAFRDAPALSRLLRYLVEHALRGDADRLKEYAVGVEVFGRGESFDPRTDTIVRVQARRLRSRLKEYYEAEGREDPIVIEVPKGHYVAVFETASAPRSRPGATPAPSSGAVRPQVSMLPAPRTRLIGRERELRAVTRLLGEEDARLVTLTGAGGSGKTRLALEVADGLRDGLAGGVYFASLASVADAVSMVSALAQVLGLRHTAGKPLVDALREHVRLTVSSPALVLLDNFEHLVAAAPVVAALLEASPPLRVLVTSREPLRVYGEREYPVPPLPAPDPRCPPPLEELERNPAVALFVERAAAIRPDFVLNAATAPAVAEICSRLDGLPLAIELAAARVKMLPPDAMLALLRNSLELLTGGARDMPARQQTLRRTIDWSHDLLGDAERRIFRRLSVFAGGFTLEGAEAVGDTRRDLGVAALDAVASLVDKSLLFQTDQKGDGARFSMLETTREYALEKLAASGEAEATRQAHAAYCLVLAEEGNAQLSSMERSAWLARCDLEHDNFRAALDWLIGGRRVDWALRLGVALFGYWDRREHLVEGCERLEAIRKLEAPANRSALQALVTSHSADLLARSRGDHDAATGLFQEALGIYRERGDQRGIAAELTSLGATARFVGDYAAARRWFEESVEVARELGDRSQTAAALSNLAGVMSTQGHHPLALSLLEEARAAFLESGDEIAVAWCINHLGDAARHAGRLDEARRLYEEALVNFRRLCDPWGAARSLADLASLAGAQGDCETARRCYGQALGFFRDLGHNTGIATVLEGFAVLAAREGDSRRALIVAGAAGALRFRIGARARPVEQAQLDRSLEGAWQDQDPGIARGAWEEGWSMPLEEAIGRGMSGTFPAGSTRS
jgi:predicted ATPase